MHSGLDQATSTTENVCHLNYHPNITKGGEKKGCIGPVSTPIQFIFGDISRSSAYDKTLGIPMSTSRRIHHARSHFGTEKVKEKTKNIG